MKSFEDLQRALIQVILDYHTAKANPVARASRTTEGLIEEDTDDEEAKASVDENDETSHLIGSWSKITDQLQTSPITDRLLALPPETRTHTLDTYINEATATHETRKPLLTSLKEVLLLLDQAINIPDTTEPETYALIYEQLADFLLNLKENIPRSGQAKTALDAFFQTIGENIHATLAICFREQKKLPYTATLEVQLEEQKATILNLTQQVANLNEQKPPDTAALKAQLKEQEATILDLRQQNQALNAVINIPKKSARTSTGAQKPSSQTVLTPHPTMGVMGFLNGLRHKPSSGETTNGQNKSSDTLSMDSL